MSNLCLEDICAQAAEALGPAVTYFFGKKARSTNPVAPVIFVVPLQDTFDQGPIGAGASGNPRNFGPRWCQFTAEFWGSDYLSTDQLFLGWVTAIRRTVQGANYRNNQALWVDQPHSKYGQAYIVHQSVLTSIPEQTLPLAVDGSSEDSVIPTVVVTSEALDTAGETTFNLPTNPMVAGTG